MNLTRLGEDELPEVTALLEANGLPTDDLGPAILFLGVRDEQGLEGIVGLERHGNAGLLRSLAVRHDRRRSGLGSALVLELERQAADEGLQALYLLTTTAAGFFAHRGYGRCSREAAPAAIAATREFTELCPSSATVMLKVLHA